MGTHDGREGRPSLFTADVRAAILLALEGGHFRATAARIAGVSSSTLHGWLKQGRTDRKAGLSSDFSQFLEQVEGAESASESRLLEKAMDAAMSLKDPAMIRWLLSTRFPRWNDRLMRKLREVEGRIKTLEGGRAG